MEDETKLEKPTASTKTSVQISMLDAAGLTGVCTDQQLTVVTEFGNTATYLQNKNFHSQLSDLLPNEVSLIFKAAAHRAMATDKRVTITRLNFEENGIKNHTVDMAITPFYTDEDAEQQLLILFSTNKKRLADSSLIASTELKTLNVEYLANLETELAEVKINLEAANELINASNENIQSFNEELQSANEEMHSANEELQSVNEELQTINREQQLTNAELMESNDDLNNYFRSNTNGQLFVDHNLLLKRFSPGAVTHINLRDTDIGRPLADITTNIKFETLVADVVLVMKEGEIITREAESSEGKIYQVMTMPYIRKGSGKTDGAIISFYEITELRNLLSGLDVSNKSLSDSVATITLSSELLSLSLGKEKHLNMMKSRFVAMASHEFKTPLTSIQLSADLIGRIAGELENPILKKFTETIKNGVKNLNNILNDFLSLELLESGKINPILDEFDVVAFAEEIIEEMQALVKREQQILYQHKGENRMATFNPSLLKNSLINLISNAIKYSGQDSRIEFSTQITKSQLIIVVKDNGIGIPKADQAHLFEAFFRAHNTGKIPGTGLGLNIVGRYITLMNGHVKFHSTLGEGTSFTLTFPIKPVLKIDS